MLASLSFFSILFFVPSFVAIVRDRKSTPVIVSLNLFLPLSLCLWPYWLIAWIGLLVWAVFLFEPKESETRVDETMFFARRYLLKASERMTTRSLLYANAWVSSLCVGLSLFVLLVWLSVTQLAMFLLPPLLIVDSVLTFFVGAMSMNERKSLRYIMTSIAVSVILTTTSFCAVWLLMKGYRTAHRL